MANDAELCECLVEQQNYIDQGPNTVEPIVDSPTDIAMVMFSLLLNHKPLLLMLTCPLIVIMFSLLLNHKPLLLMLTCPLIVIMLNHKPQLLIH